MVDSKDKNNIFSENFGESGLSATELFDTLQWSVLQQEAIAEIIPLLSNDIEISQKIIHESLERIGNVTKEAAGLYKIEQQQYAFVLKGYYIPDSRQQKPAFPEAIHYDTKDEILKKTRAESVVQLGSQHNQRQLHQFFHRYFESKYGTWWILPVQIKDKIYGLLTVNNPDMNTVNNLLLSFYKSVALVFAQAFDRVSVIAANKAMLERVEKANRLKTIFLSNVSNEVRTPVNAIVGFSDLLADPDLTIDQREEFITMITKSSRSLVKMFDNIIDASKLKSQQIQFKKEWADVNAILNELVHDKKGEESQDEYARYNVNFNVHKLPADKEVQIYTDVYRVHQILEKLLENAREHTCEGEIEVGVSEAHEELMFFVRDSGKGIDKEEHGEVFSLFESEEHAFTFESGGTGLGLSIAKELAGQLGGRLRFESELNKGTTFYLCFPENFYKVKTLSTSQSVNKPFDWSDKSILIAEDVEFNYIFLREIIATTGARVYWAKNGVEACQAVEENPDIDLVLMDLQMPEMNGYEAAEIIKQQKPHLPIIAQTAFMMANEDQKCFEIGCEDFLSKPIKPKRLINVIDKYLK